MTSEMQIERHGLSDKRDELFLWVRRRGRTRRRRPLSGGEILFENTYLHRSFFVFISFFIDTICFHSPFSIDGPHLASRSIERGQNQHSVSSSFI